MTNVPPGATLNALMPATAALITLLILERPMCVACIADRAHTTPQAVESYLAEIGKTVDVESAAHERCLTCGTVGVTYALSRID
jgi:hypothetical protein